MNKSNSTVLKKYFRKLHPQTRTKSHL